MLTSFLDNSSKAFLSVSWCCSTSQARNILSELWTGSRTVLDMRATFGVVVTRKLKDRDTCHFAAHSCQNNLRTLILSECSNISGKGLKPLTNSTVLEYLNLTGINVGDRKEEAQQVRN